jgi:calcium/calmodulin-dependent protein kinase I
VAEVWHDSERSTGKDFACKFKRTNIDVEALHELEVMQRLRHPHIIKGYSSNRENEQAIIMEYLSSSLLNLATYLYITGPLSESEAADIFRQVIQAVEFMHSQGYAHGDLKRNCD